ncbi:CidA/LrgA family protein [Vibrio sp. S17_S38]|uniref:CidA/LrgA family protein n=1 Tax=Vibrio sp. S17_S38 TaxID=2720229 RepID=UPI001680CF0B|nr:CidA/LrgA family protein [Vibrio sp. S17_S38]MBD1573504.1 CidA/LrgA family protein [Vibrio sp. S17_S38]
MILSKIKTISLIFIQVISLCILWFFADQTVQAFHIPMPSNVFGLLVLLGLMFTGIINIKWLKIGSMWLLAEMLLFFIPAVIAIINYQDLFIHDGIKIMAVILLSTCFVLGVTAYVVEKIYRYEVKKMQRKY